MSVTKDFSEFGYVEREEAQKLLAVYGTSKDKTKLLGQGVEVYFNTMSGYVFLSDEDYNTAMLNVDDELEDFLVCSNCGHEDMASDFMESAKTCCLETYQFLEEY
jgi:hypothetical protein